jgi:hypothetical protein
MSGIGRGQQASLRQSRRPGDSSLGSNPRRRHPCYTHFRAANNPEAHKRRGLVRGLEGGEPLGVVLQLLGFKPGRDDKGFSGLARLAVLLIPPSQPIVHRPVGVSPQRLFHLRVPMQRWAKPTRPSRKGRRIDISRTAARGALRGRRSASQRRGRSVRTKVFIAERRVKCSTGRRALKNGAPILKVGQCRQTAERERLVQRSRPALTFMLLAEVRKRECQLGHSRVLACNDQLRSTDVDQAESFGC